MRHIQHFTKSIPVFSPITVHLIFIKCDASSVLNTFVLRAVAHCFCCLSITMSSSLDFCFVLLCSAVCYVCVYFFLIRWFHNQHHFDAVEWPNLLRARICNAYIIYIYSVHTRTRTRTTSQASWMGAAVLQHVEDHLKMDNGENIHRNLNEFNSNGWDSISFVIYIICIWLVC